MGPRPNGGQSKSVADQGTRKCLLPAVLSLAIDFNPPVCKRNLDWPIGNDLARLLDVWAEMRETGMPIQPAFLSLAID